MSEHSIVGGSTAERLLQCYGSFQAVLALPPSVDRPSEYAEEGTAMHAVKAALMERRRQDPNLAVYTLAKTMVGETFHDRALTIEHLQTMIEPALQALAELEQFYGGGFEVVAVERRVAFPGIPGSFGTIDLILRNRHYVLHVDWKFGGGVPVSATYQTPIGELLNPQIAYYVTAARATLRSVYKTGLKLVGAIIQPRMDNVLTHTIIDPVELKYFRQDLVRAVSEAIKPNPPRRKGEWCRWAPCKSTCPLWTGPLLDLSAIPILGAPQPVAADHPEANAYGEYLAHAKALADLAAIFKSSIDEQMHAFLENGGKIPGWRLKAKVKQRRWVEEKELVPRLRKLGFKVTEIYVKELLTFKAADSIAKRLGVDPKLLDEWKKAPPSDETTLATTDDPAPVVNREATIAKFQASLKKIGESVK